MRKNRKEIISGKGKAMDSAVFAGEYLGRKVYSRSGEFVGKVADIVMTGDRFSGIVIKNKPSFMSSLVIDKEFFSSDSVDAIMLSIDPVTYLIGKQVYDADGRKLGKVSGLDRNTYANDFSYLLVKKNIISKPFVVPKADIEIAKKNILLNKKYEQK